MNLLVTDGDERAALAIVRSLGTLERVYVGSPSGRSIAGGSRFARGEVQLPSPLSDPAAFLNATSEVVRTREIDAVFPITDAACRVLVRVRERIAPAWLVAPASLAYERLSDKAEVAQLAREHGLSVPAGCEVASLEAALSAASDLRFPVVLKPSNSVLIGDEGVARKVGVVRVVDDSALRAAWDALGGSRSALIQRVVPGWGEGIFLLRWAGRTHAAFAHRRLREKPPSGGVSVLCESVALDPERARRVEAIMDAVGYDGLAMAEFKTDGREAWLMEFNARPWGSLQLAIDAGVDFPRLLLEAHRETRPDKPPPYAVGVRSRWLLGDLDHALALARGATDGKGRTGISTALGVLLRPAGPGCRWEDLRLRDAEPFRRALARWIRALWRKS